MLKKITSPTVESEHSQISNNPELLFVLAPTLLEQIKYLVYSQFENVHFLTVGEIIILPFKRWPSFLYYSEGLSEGNG